MNIIHSESFQGIQSRTKICLFRLPSQYSPLASWQNAPFARPWLWQYPANPFHYSGPTSINRILLYPHASWQEFQCPYPEIEAKRKKKHINHKRKNTSLRLSLSSRRIYKNSSGKYKKPSQVSSKNAYILLVMIIIKYFNIFCLLTSISIKSQIKT